MELSSIAAGRLVLIALGGGILHVWKGRPWIGLTVFAIIVVVVPALVWPSMATGLFSDLTGDL